MRVCIKSLFGILAVCADAEAATGSRHLAGRGRAYYISRARERAGERVRASGGGGGGAPRFKLLLPPFEDATCRTSG